MSITFSGLATGLDTDTIVTQLMELERAPITRLESDKSWFESRQSAYAAFDGLMTNFLSSVESMESSEDLRQKSVSASSSDFFSVSASADALPNTSYQVEVVSLAQVQKNVSQGYANKSASTFGEGELSLTVGDEDPVTITIDETNNSLEGVMAAINDADAGVNASIINDGTDSPYRLVLTGENVASSFSLSSTLPTFNGDISSQLNAGGFASETTAYFGSGTIDLSTTDPSTGLTTVHQVTLSPETTSLTDMMTAINDESTTTGVTASIVADGDNFVLSLSGGTLTETDLTGGYQDPFSLIETQAAAEAHIIVDNIDIYSDSNTLDEAIPGLTLDLTQAEADTTTTVSVSLDEDAIKSQINSFVSGYNSIMSFIGAQSASEESSGGVLGGDAGMGAVKRRLQNMMTSIVDNSGVFSSLSQLGFETQTDGTIEIDDDDLTVAIQNNLDSIESLLLGDDGESGIVVQFENYLEGMTDSIDGLYAANKTSTESSVKRIDARIEQMEMRLEKKEETMRSKFTSLEELISGMNSQSSFLTQQLDMLNNMISGDS